MTSTRPLSSSSPAAGSSAGAAGPDETTAAPAEGKADSKASQVVAALAQRTLEGKGASSRVLAEVQSTLGLEDVERQLPHTPKVDLRFLDKGDRTLLSRIFGWSLTNRLSLADILLFDLFYHLEEIRPLLSAYHTKMKFAAAGGVVHTLDEIFQRCYAEMAVGYVTLMVEDNRVQGQSDFAQHVTTDASSKSKWVLGLDRISWTGKLDLMKKMVKEIAGVSPQLKGKKQYLNAVVDRIDLLCKILKSSEALPLLLNQDLRTLKKHFPTAADLQKGSPEACLLALRSFIKFVSSIFVSARELRYLACNPIAFEGLQKCLDEAPDQSKEEDIQKFKKELSWSIDELFKIHDQACVSLILAHQGRLTHKQWLAGFNIETIRAKSQEEFIGQLFMTAMECALTTGFIQDIMHIYDRRVLVARSPETYATIEAVYFRLNTNLDWLFRQCGPEQIVERPHLQSALASLSTSMLPQADKVKAHLPGFDEKLARLWLPFLPKTSEFIQIFKEFQSMLQDAKGMYGVWRNFIRDNFMHVIENYDGLLEKLDELREQNLKGIEEFLMGLSAEEFLSCGPAWCKFFEEYCFSVGLDFCRASMLAKDMEGLLSLNPTINSASGRHLVPEELSNFMTLDGIEEVMERVRAAKFKPMREDTTGRPHREPRARQEVAEGAGAGAAAPPEARTESAAERAQLMSLTAAPAKAAAKAAKALTREQTIKLRRGMKNRKILALVKELFFAKRQESSHMQMQNKETGRMATFLAPVGSHKHLKPGMLHSYEKKLNEGKEGKRS